MGKEPFPRWKARKTVEQVLRESRKAVEESFALLRRIAARSNLEIQEPDEKGKPPENSN